MLSIVDTFENGALSYDLPSPKICVVNCASRMAVSIYKTTLTLTLTLRLIKLPLGLLELIKMK